MSVKRFKTMNHEQNLRLIEKVGWSLKKNLPCSRRNKRSPLKVSRGRHTSVKSDHQIVPRSRITHSKYLRRRSLGDARGDIKIASNGRKTRSKDQLPKHVLPIYDAHSNRFWIRKTGKQKQFLLILFKGLSDGFRQFSCRQNNGLTTNVQSLGSRVTLVVRIRRQPISPGFRRIGRRPFRFFVRRAGSLKHNLSARSNGRRHVSLGVRSIRCETVSLQYTRDQPVRNQFTGKRLIGSDLNSFRLKGNYSYQRSHTFCGAHSSCLKDSPVEEVSAKYSELSSSRSDTECQDNSSSNGRKSRHSQQEEQKTHDIAHDSVPLVCSGQTRSRTVGHANGRLSGMRLPTLLLVCLLAAVTESCPYSSVDPRHTMCVFTPKQCPGKMLIRTGELTCHDKERILTKHNMLRQEAALGQVRGQPAAINMKTMVWDDELAMVAQRWADQCMPGHDRSRNVARFAAGQNVAAVWTYDRDEGVEPDFSTQVEAWFMEVDQHGFSKGAVDPFKFSKPTGHYTQLVWADTYLVGCGYTYYHDAAGNGYTKLYVCNYGPGGNVVGGSMYKVGYPGQPYCVANGLRPSTDYQGLCEEDGVNYKSMCSMGGSSMFHKPKTSSLMMLMDGNSVVDDFAHSHARSNSRTHPMEVMHPDPPHMEMHDMMQHHSSMMRNGPSRALHQQQGHMMLPPPPLPHNFPPNHIGGNGPHNQGLENGLIKNIQAPFSGLVNALSPWNFLNRFKMN